MTRPELLDHIDYCREAERTSLPNHEASALWGQMAAEAERLLELRDGVNPAELGVSR